MKKNKKSINIQNNEIQSSETGINFSQNSKTNKHNSKQVFIYSATQIGELFKFLKMNKLLLALIILVVLAIISVITAIYILFPINSNSQKDSKYDINKPVKTLSEFAYLPTFYNENLGFVIKGSQMTFYNYKDDDGETEKKINLPFTFNNLSKDSGSPTYGWVDEDTIYYTTSKNLIIFNIETQRVKELENFFDDVIADNSYLQNICYSNDMFAFTISNKDEKFFENLRNKTINSNPDASGSLIYSNSDLNKYDLSNPVNSPINNPANNTVNNNQNNSLLTSSSGNAENIEQAIKNNTSGEENNEFTIAMKNNINLTGSYNAIKSIKGELLYYSSDNVYFISTGEGRYSSISAINNVYYSSSSRSIKALDTSSEVSVKCFDKYTKSFSYNINITENIYNLDLKCFEILSYENIDKKLHFFINQKIADENIFYYQSYDLSTKKMKTSKVSYKPLNFCEKLYTDILPSGNLIINFKTPMIEGIDSNQTVLMKYSPPEQNSQAENNNSYSGEFNILDTNYFSESLDNDDSEVFFTVTGENEDIIFAEIRNEKLNTVDYFEKTQNTPIIKKLSEFVTINADKNNNSIFKRSDNKIDISYSYLSDTEFSIVNSYNGSSISQEQNNVSSSVYIHDQPGYLINPISDDTGNCIAVFNCVNIGINNYYYGNLIVLLKDENGNWNKIENDDLNKKIFYYDNSYLNKKQYFWSKNGENLILNFDNDNTYIYNKTLNQLISLENKSEYFNNNKGILFPLEAEFTEIDNDIVYLKEFNGEIYLDRINIDNLFNQEIENSDIISIKVPSIKENLKYSNPLSLCWFDNYKIMIMPQTSSQNFQGVFFDYSDKSSGVKNLEYNAFGGASSADGIYIIYGVLLEDENYTSDLPTNNLNTDLNKQSSLKYYSDTYIYNKQTKEYNHCKLNAKEYILNYNGNNIFTKSIDDKTKYILYDKNGENGTVYKIEKLYGSQPKFGRSSIIINS